MKISELENIVMKNSSKINITRGQELSKNKFFDIDIRKVDEFYNIYGTFKSNDSLKRCKPHLRIDLKNKKVVFTKCSCSIFEENDLDGRIYMCEHLTAAGMKFIQSIKKRLKAKHKISERPDKKIIKELKDIYETINIDNMKIYNEKEKININISLKQAKEEKENLFYVSMQMGNSIMYTINNIKECIFAIKDKKEYSIGKGFIYNYEKYYFSKEDEKALDYLYEFLMISSDENKNFIKIHSNILRKFLENFNGRQIKFTYNYQNYTSKILKNDLPLSFTMKKINGEYIITTKKVFPVPLNNSMDLFLYDRNIYIPSFEQINLYRVLYENLKKNNKIVLKSDISDEEFNILNKVITSISQNVFYDEAVIEKINEGLKIEFNFSRENGKSICRVSIKSSVLEMDYCQALKINNDNMNVSKKLNEIERILNRYRFYCRNEVFQFLGNDEEYYEFLKSGMNKIGEAGNVFTDIDCSKYFKLNNGNFKEFSIRKNSKGKFDFHMGLENIQSYELNHIAQAYKEKKSFIKLENDTFVNLESSEIENVMKIIDTLNLDITRGADKFELSFNKLYYLKDKIENGKIYSENKDRLLKLFDSIENMKDKIYEVPEKLKCTLRQYQKEGYEWFRNLKSLGLGGILGDEMGLGKTIQTIAFLASQEEGTSIVIVPTSLLYNWNEEFRKFAPDLRVGIVHGEINERKKIIGNYFDYNVILTTYGTLKNDAESYMGIEFNNMILDEGQNIKNHKAQITGIIKNLNALNRFILTGTPIENNLEELWSLFDFIMPGYLYSNSEFKNKFVRNDSNIDELKILIKPYILRRTKKEAIFDMPQKHEEKVLVEMPEQQKNIYYGFVNKIQENIKADNEKSVSSITIFSYLTKLRELCLHPGLIDEEYKGESGKFNKVIELIKESNGKDKILLFSQFTKALKKLSIKFDIENIPYCYLDGNTKAAERIKIVEEFNNNEEKRVFLISLKAGGTGLNLTSANTVIHLDPWWNPSIEDQATDRAHRIGQKNNVKVIKLITKGTIEEKIILLQDDKRNIINDVLTNELNDSSVLTSITNDELMELLK